VEGLSFEYSDAPAASGDMGGTHVLGVDPKYMKHKSWWDPHQTYQVSWEGFDASVAEEAHRIRDWDGETDISPEKTVAEGHYLLDIGMKRKEDTTQQQKIQVQFEVDYGLEFDTEGEDE
jgi:hypothetical protein